MPASGPGEDRTRLVLGRIRSSRGRIAFTYLLTLLENAFELMYPWAIGIAINGLLVGREEMLVPFVAIWLAHILLGGCRQLYDTRLFSRIYAAMAADIVTLQRQQGEPVSDVSARVEMTREFTEFLETEVPIIVAALISLVGSVVLLVLYDLWAGLVMLALLAPVGLINAVMGQRAMRANNDLNSRWENQVNVISTGRPGPVRAHFGRLARLRIRLSDMDAASWTFAEFLTLVAITLVLLRIASLPGVLAGDIFASLAYVIRIADSIDEIPGVVQQLGRLIDIRRRIGRF